VSIARIFPVIMSGGSGTRLWPLSNEARPKQFHALPGPNTMIGETALRLQGVHSGEGGNIMFLPPIIISGERHGELVAEHLSAAGVIPAAVVLEPQGRNTAATAALAAFVARQLDEDALVLLMPADHIVADPAAFIAAIQRATKVVESRIVTFGIEPTGPETGYGYICQGELLADGVFAISRFAEKPSREVAEGYLAEGGYSWNSGVFYFRPDLMLEEFSHGAADIRDGSLVALESGERSGNEYRLDAEAFAKVRSEPVDIAVMEKTRRAAVAPCSIGWADVGSWSEVWRLGTKDAAGNSVAGSVKVLDGQNNLVMAHGVHVSIAGVTDLIIVATPDAVIVLPKDRAQDVKKLIP
jgi:mannose-1-phosphate guanylyltransferase/mannose-6-phosphate isomerase